MRQFLILSLATFIILHSGDTILMHEVRADLRNKDYSQKQILHFLYNEKRLNAKTPRELTKYNHSYIKSLVTLLGLKAEQDGYLDPKAYDVFKVLPSEVLKDCTKAIRRTWLLDEEFCTRYLPAKVYALPYEEVLKVQSSHKQTRLKPEMMQSDISPKWCERDAQLHRKSTFIFSLPYNTIRSSHGKLFDRFEKRCTLDDAGYVEVIQLKKLNWQELFLLHQLALINQQSMKAGSDVKSSSAQLLKQYHSLKNKYKKHIERVNYWHLFKKKKKTLFELRLQEIESV